MSVWQVNVQEIITEITTRVKDGHKSVINTLDFEVRYVI